MSDERDDELLARLRAGDPGVSLPPADPHRVARLLEDTMAERTDTHPGTRPDPGGGHDHDHDVRRRGPLTWAVAAVAVLLVAGGAVLALVDRGSGPGDTPVAGPASTPTARATTGGTTDDTTSDTTTVLSAPGARVAARCLPPRAATLRGQEVAVDATATEVTGRQVTLVPDRFYAGTRADVVVVRAAPAELSALVGAVRFREGERYLVSARDGEVSVCGLSGPWSQSLADLYAEAFGA